MSGVAAQIQACEILHLGELPRCYFIQIHLVAHFQIRLRVHVDLEQVIQNLIGFPFLNRYESALLDLA